MEGDSASDLVQTIPKCKEPLLGTFMGVAGKDTGLSNAVLMLLFTRGVKIRDWDSVGMFDREIELYRRILPELSGIRFLTYGDKSEEKYCDKLGGIGIVLNKRRIKPTKFSVLAPFVLQKEFRSTDIIKTNQIDGAWTGVIAKVLFKKKLIVRCGYLWSVFQQKRLGDGFYTRSSMFLEKFCMRLADVCVVATPSDKEYIERVHGIQSEKIRIVPNYVDTNVFRQIPEIKKEAGLVCFVGRLKPQKNVEALFEACKGQRGIKLLVIGDSKQRDTYKRKAEEFGLCVEFHASIPNNELPLHLNRAQVFVLPSLYEGCPKTLIEAMACELPVIGTNVEGIRDIIRDGENGVLCDTSPESIRNAIVRVLNGDVSTDQMGRKARHYVIEHHSLDRIAQMELEIIRTCMQSVSHKSDG